MVLVGHQRGPLYHKSVAPAPTFTKVTSMGNVFGAGQILKNFRLEHQSKKTKSRSSGSVYGDTLLLVRTNNAV